LFDARWYRMRPDCRQHRSPRRRCDHLVASLADGSREYAVDQCVSDDRLEAGEAAGRVLPAIGDLVDPGVRRAFAEALHELAERRLIALRDHFDAAVREVA